MKARIFAPPGDAGVISMNLPSSRLEIAETRAWVERVVIGLNLCPFAKAPQIKGQVRYALSEAREPEALLAGLVDELNLLAGTPAERIETTLLVHPHVLADFADYNDFLGLAEEAVAELGLEGVIQVASFHPQYQFAGSARRRPRQRDQPFAVSDAAPAARGERRARRRRVPRGGGDLRGEHRDDATARRIGLGEPCSSSAAMMRTVPHARSARRAQAAKSRRKRRTISTV